MRVVCERKEICEGCKGDRVWSFDHVGVVI